jgi:type VI protein secretion system component VasK
MNALVLVLLLWLSIHIAKARNWARVTFAVLTVSVLVMAPFVVLKEFSASSTIGMLSSIFGLFLFFALLVLYSRNTRSWYANQFKGN